MAPPESPGSNASKSRNKSKGGMNNDKTPKRSVPTSLKVSNLLKKHCKQVKTDAYSGISSKDVHVINGVGLIAAKCNQYLVVQSSLSPNLSDILKNDLVLPYLIQYLQVSKSFVLLLNTTLLVFCGRILCLLL